MRRFALPLVVSLALVAPGCGGSSKSSKAGSVTADFHAAADAMAAGDGSAACRYFTASVSGTLSSSSGLSCAAAVSELARPLTASDRDGVKNVAVKVVSNDGSRATVVYPVTSGLRKLGFTGRSRLVQSGGRWLIAPRNG